ncbi:MAG: DUF5009 domain-containing protein [Bacteroidetes bacterium]|nr:DUF5009 domain-containing protein [Bacteroidota bacterium]
MSELKPSRLASIDVFRALTMFLMIFVNDLWTLQDVPNWLEHAAANEDGLGLADVVFPAFLFIVGLSVPFATNQRLAKGDSEMTILKHTLLRSLALIVMGVFHVNLESYNASAILSKPLWEILITLAFFFIWLDYPKNLDSKRKFALEGLGIAVLLAMALVYRGGTIENPVWMKTQWWGILGLIGWSYLIASLLYLFFRKSLRILLMFMMFFIFFSAAEKLHWLDPFKFIQPYFWIVSDGSLPAIVMAGIVVACVYKESLEAESKKKFFGLLISGSLVMILICFATRSLWGIHKIGASPSWVALCIGISGLFFVLLVWLVDINRKENWFSILKPAGTSTLTSYLLPYFHYSIISWIGVSLPLFLRTGMIGIAKSLLYSLVIIFITGLLEKKRIRLKI